MSRDTGIFFSSIMVTSDSSSMSDDFLIDITSKNVPGTIKISSSPSTQERDRTVARYFP